MKSQFTMDGDIQLCIIHIVMIFHPVLMDNFTQWLHVDGTNLEGRK